MRGAKASDGKGGGRGPRTRPFTLEEPLIAAGGPGEAALTSFRV